MSAIGSMTTIVRRMRMASGEASFSGPNVAVPVGSLAASGSGCASRRAGAGGGADRSAGRAGTGAGRTGSFRCGAPEPNQPPPARAPVSWAVWGLATTASRCGVHCGGTVSWRKPTGGRGAGAAGAGSVDHRPVAERMAHSGGPGSYSASYSAPAAWDGSGVRGRASEVRGGTSEAYRGSAEYRGSPEYRDSVP